VHIDETVLTSAVGRLTQRSFEPMDTRAALSAIVNSMPSLFSVDGAGVLLLDEAQDLRYVASTDQGAQVLEAIQETTGHGPCVSSLIDDTVVVVDDILTDPRWPDLREVLSSNGIRGVVGAPLHVAGAPIGSLNIYHRHARGWDQSDRDALHVFAQIAERLLAHALLAQHHDTVAEQLTHALSARINIDRAVGMIMVIEDCDAADAFELLRRSARSSRRTASDIASDVLVARKLP